MKLIFTDEENAKRNRIALQKERLKGNMVCMYTDKNRKWTVQNNHMLANCFITTSGAFAFSGCYRLVDKVSAHLDELIKVLDENHIPYSFQKEDPSACGGMLTIGTADPSIDNSQYAYIVRFANEEQKDMIERQMQEQCQFHPLDHDKYYVTFADIDLEDTKRILEERVMQFASRTNQSAN